MSVDALHDSYSYRVPDWSLMRDSIEGDRAIKKAGVKYVPKLSNQTADSDAYISYISRPAYTNYTQRVLDGLTGLVFAKDAEVKVPKSLEVLLKNIDLEGNTLVDYAQKVTTEVESVGRVGTLIDIKGDSARPYTTIYTTENIINWRYETINNETVLVMVVLKEVEKVWLNDFDSENKDRYRALLLEDGKYIQRVYREKPKENSANKTATEWDIEEINPLMNGKSLTYIPFVPLTQDELTLEPPKPPLLDLADKNISHFRINCDFYYGMHKIAFATIWGAGVQIQEGKTFNVGGDEIHLFPDPNAKLDILEIKGDGFGTFEREITRVEEQITVLGSNMLQADKKVAEAENTVAMRNAGQNATLISTADTVSRGITKVLEIIAEWSGNNGEIEYSLNTDFDLTQIEAAMMKVIVDGATLGKIP